MHLAIEMEILQKHSLRNGSFIDDLAYLKPMTFNQMIEYQQVLYFYMILPTPEGLNHS
jgi:hypothetical protein